MTQERGSRRDGLLHVRFTAQHNWRSRNPEKRSAHLAVQKAMRTGALNRQPCAVCGTMKNVDAHHEDYSQPLKVRWLCRRHHKQRHKQMRCESG